MLSESQIKQAAQFLLEEHEARKPLGPGVCLVLVQA